MYIKYNNGIPSIKKFISFTIKYVNLNNAEFWYLDANDVQRNGYNIKKYETKEEAEKELSNIAKAIKDGRHIYTIK
jgi:hypothetical protein